MTISFSVSTNALPVYDGQDGEITRYDINRADPFNLTITGTLDPGDTFISSSFTVDVPDGGVPYSNTDLVATAGGTFSEVLYEGTPTYSYIDTSYQSHTVNSISDIPTGGDYYSLTSYTSPTKYSADVKFTFSVFYNTRVDDESGGGFHYEDVTAVREVTIRVRNNWTADKDTVENLVASSPAQGGGGGLPLSFVGSPTSGHATYPPSVLVAGSGKVMVGGAPAAYDSSVAAPHTNTVPNFDTHIPVAVGGSSKVYIEGKLAVRIADNTNCGGCVVSGSPKTLSV